MNNKALIQKVIDYTLIGVFFLFPLTLNISIASFKDETHPLLAVNFSISDLLIGLLLLIWMLKVIVYKQSHIIKYPPKEILFFVLIGLLSVINATSLSQWLKEFIQIVEYFVIFYLLIINNLASIEVRIIKNCLFIVTTLMLVIAFIQHILFKSDVYFVRGLFLNENVLGTFLSIVSPLIYTQLLGAKNIPTKIWMVGLLVLTCIVLLSGSAMWAILIALLVVSIIYSSKATLTYVAVVLLLGIAYTVIIPDKNKSAIKSFSSIYEQGKISDNYYLRLAMLAGSNKTEIFKKDLGDNKYFMVSSNFSVTQNKLDVPQGDLYKEFNNKVAIKNRYLEMQASMIMLSEYTPLGVGLGNFQDKIGMYYTGFPKVNTAEPEQHNEYLLIAATTGIMGLTAFLWIFISSCKNNWKRYIVNKQEVFYLGLLGSIISMSLEGFFSSLLSSSLLVPFILIICLSFTDFNHAKNTA
ncbi:O-antigen ligase family protein [Mucilaginibacter lappiensis]|uniref:O-antigen ligase-related domain-containing protein n=1 Tax=Mucilaginibacter lappiensis TaxID=354630 RepID=A0A841JSW5_9SPHI|nr:O-antigen ligase family protein [Mucilaginibacter lappiensis]MBB6130921.1 hypothetical protein [Mucilaginibacter lappiensis]